MYADDSFNYAVLNLLPKLQPIMQDATCKRIVERDALRVHIVDTEWGRPFWLFEKIIAVLDEVLDEVHS